MNKSDQDILNYTNQLSKNLILLTFVFVLLEIEVFYIFIKNHIRKAIVDFTSAIELSEQKIFLLIRQYRVKKIES